MKIDFGPRYGAYGQLKQLKQLKQTGPYYFWREQLKQLKQLVESAAKAPAAAPMVDAQPAQQAQTGMAIVRVDEGLGEETRRTHTNLRSDEYRMRHCSCRQGHCKAQGSAR